jgi:NAD(P)-dependent dehydrogenase (short-subunit alcohol dehydrogenase family)
MANLILVTGAAGRVGGIGRTVTELLLEQGKAVRAMVRNEDERAQALRDMGAEVVVGNLLDLDSMHRVIDGCNTMYFGLSVSDAQFQPEKIFPLRRTRCTSSLCHGEGVFRDAGQGAWIFMSHSHQDYDKVRALNRNW